VYAGRPTREDSFPNPYALFQRFDYDKKGELNYREYADLLAFINNDFTDPKRTCLCGGVVGCALYVPGCVCVYERIGWVLQKLVSCV